MIPPFLAYDQAMRYLAAIILALLVLTGCQIFDEVQRHRQQEYSAEIARIKPLAERGDAVARFRLG